TDAAGWGPSTWRAVRATLRSGPAAINRLPAKAVTRVESGWETCIGVAWRGRCASLLFSPDNIQEALLARVWWQPIMDCRRRDRSMADRHRDLVQRADHVADGVETVDTGLQVGVGMQRAFVVDRGAQVAGQLRARITAQYRIERVVFPGSAVLQGHGAGRGVAAQPALGAGRDRVHPSRERAQELCV